MLNSRFSYESVRRFATDHGERIVSRLDVDWNTLLVEARKKPATVDLWEPLPSSDLALILFTDGEIIFETREGRRTSRRAVRPGQGRIIPSGSVEQVRWLSDVSRNILRLTSSYRRNSSIPVQMSIDPQAVDLVRSRMPSPGLQIRRSTLSADPWLTQSTMECQAFMQIRLRYLSQSTCFHRGAGLIFSPRRRIGRDRLAINDWLV
jgi:hypothetical protein